MGVEMRARAVAGAAMLMFGLVACGSSGARQSEETRRFCDEAERVDDHLNEGIEFGNVSDDDVISGLEDLTDLAPDEVVDDVVIVGEAYTIAVDEGDDAVFAEPEVQDATGRFADFLDEECGISN